jgi:integrase
VRPIKATLYIRERATQKYKKAKRNASYPEGTIFVLRYATAPRQYKWETLKDCLTFGQAEIERRSRELDLLRGKKIKQKSRRCLAAKPKKDDWALDVLLDEYLGDGKAAEKNWRPRTLRAYKQAIQLFMESVKPKICINEIDGDDLKRFKVFLRKQKTSVGKSIDGRTVYNHFNNIVSFLNEYGKSNLIKQSDWPTYEDKKPVAYDEAVMAKILRYADEDEADVIEFFLGDGFRNGEGTHIEWHDFDYNNREVHTYSKIELFGWRVKDSEERIVGIPDRLAERLKKRHERHPDDGLIFPNSRGKPDKHLLRIIKRVALRAGLNCGRCFGTYNRKRVCCRTHPVCGKWKIHPLRKTWATYQHREGVDVRTIQHDLGHSSLETTLRYLAAEDRRSERRRAQINAADMRVQQHMTENQNRVQ